MKLISWNVNGIRAILKKDFHNFFQSQQPDILCLQETKANPEQVQLQLPGYEIFWNWAEKPGYSGTAVITRIPPLRVSSGMEWPEHDREGRVITAEFEKFFLVNVYTPNSGDELKRLTYRTEWDRVFKDYVAKLALTKPVVVCGDLNVAHEEIDLARPDSNHRSPGFTDEEREGFRNLLGANFIDSFRSLYPDARDCYTWWSYRTMARQRNVGWRIDYFCLSAPFKAALKNAFILAEVTGSDHCPVGIELRD